MTLEIGLSLSILTLSLILFVTGWVKPDVTAMAVLLALVISGLISPAESFHGFSSFAVMAIAGLLIISKGLEITGVVRWVARRLENIAGKSFKKTLFLNSSIPGALSGFINIVAAATFFIPVILRLSRKMDIAPSKFLMPMAFAALTGANLTLIGASHNLVVHSFLEDTAGSGFGFFEFTAFGAIFLALALIYIYFFSDKSLPESHGEGISQNGREKNLISEYGLENRLYEIWISEEFPEGAINPEELANKNGYGLTLVEVLREGEHILFSNKEIKINKGDLLLVEGKKRQVKKFCHSREGLVFMGPPSSKEIFSVSNAELAEAVVPPRSRSIGKTIAEMKFKKKYGLRAIACFKGGKPHRTFVQQAILEEGDGILFYGPRERIRDFGPAEELLIYHKPGQPEVSPDKKKFAPAAALILIAVIVVSALDYIPIAVAALTGAGLMVIMGILGSTKAYSSIDWKTIVLIGGMYPMGIALNKTGAADYIGGVLVDSLGQFGPIAVMAGISILAMILTQPIHNAAAAIIMAPIAINAAELMGIGPKPYCLAVLIACSATFILPYGHPAPFLVQSPGGYKSRDYFKFGLPLNIIALIVILVFIPLIWGFE